MGSCISCVSDKARLVISLIQNLGLDFTNEQWEEAHNTGTTEEASDALSSLGVDLKSASTSTIPSSLSKALFICCNTYTRADYSLGVGPMNDAITVATFFKAKGFKVYYLHNPTSTAYLKWLDVFLAKTQNYLFTYYTGHGSSIDDTHGDETDGKDECYVFDDAFVIDDVLCTHLKQNKTKDSLKVVLFSDCCHSGTIWDLSGDSTLPPNVMSISAARDEETAKQTVVDNKDQGIFTFYFFKLLSNNLSMTPNEMKSTISTYLKRFDQQYSQEATTGTLLNESIL